MNVDFIIAGWFDNATDEGYVDGSGVALAERG